MSKKYLIQSLLLIISITGFAQKNKETDRVKSYFETRTFQFEKVKGIGFEPGVTRRDNSDIIKVGKNDYVYYTKVLGKSPGYWGTIWVAVSSDEGHSWNELGEVLGVGKKGSWDNQAVFTPNIIEENGVYYLFYTGVQPTPGNVKGEFENNSVNDFTAIGVAKSSSPTGPFIRISGNPVLTVSSNKNDFDSYRVDDAVLLKKENKFWLYYKGRKYADGKQGPSHTKMGVAFSGTPAGPFEKFADNPILANSHEVFTWKQNGGVACLASISSTFEFAADGLDFTTNPVSVAVDRDKLPKAPGAFRADLTGAKSKNELTWGISMIHNGANCYLVRWKLETKTENQ